MTRTTIRLPLPLQRQNIVLGFLSATLGIPLIAAGAHQATPLPADEVAIVAEYPFPEMALAELQNAALPDHPIADDRGVLLGGVGSDLWQGPDDPDDEFWLVTDRGPNDELEVDVGDDEEDRRIFPVPDFTPLILQVRAEGDGLTVLQAIPLVNQHGEPVTGLPNLEEADQAPFDYAASERIPYSPDGIDPEGMVRAADGGFWLAEEYRPSLVKVSPDGIVQARYVPRGVNLDDAGYPVEDTLPAIYAMRKENRGFEGLALSDDGQTLYALLQSPLSNPDEDTGEASRVGRILAVDTATGQPVAEYAYPFEAAQEFDPELKKKDQNEMKLSGLVWLDETTLLVLERSDELARLYAVDLREATNILGSTWDDPVTTPSLESLDLADLAAAGIQPLAKRLLVDLAALPSLPEKVEGVAVVDEQTVAIINDNDFGIGDFNEAGRYQGTGDPSTLFLIAAPLP